MFCSWIQGMQSIAQVGRPSQPASAGRSSRFCKPYCTFPQSGFQNQTEMNRANLVALRQFFASWLEVAFFGSRFH